MLVVLVTCRVAALFPRERARILLPRPLHFRKDWRLPIPNRRCGSRCGSREFLIDFAVLNAETSPAERRTGPNALRPPMSGAAGTDRRPPLPRRREARSR